MSTGTPVTRTLMLAEVVLCPCGLLVYCSSASSRGSDPSAPPRLSDEYGKDKAASRAVRGGAKY
jgi:hypothetical protein